MRVPNTNFRTGLSRKNSKVDCRKSGERRSSSRRREWILNLPPMERGVNAMVLKPSVSAFSIPIGLVDSVELAQESRPDQIRSEALRHDFNLSFDAFENRRLYRDEFGAARLGQQLDLT